MYQAGRKTLLTHSSGPGSQPTCLTFPNPPTYDCTVPSQFPVNSFIGWNSTLNNN